MFGLFKGFKTTLKYFFKPKVTIMYPEEKPVMPERFRGIQRIRIEKCINCNMCVNICPTDAITLKGERDPETKKPKLLEYDINFERCMRCELCTEVCPTDALVFTTRYENMAVYDRRALTKDINWVSGNHRYGNYYDEVEEGRPEGLPTAIVPPAPPPPRPPRPAAAAPAAKPALDASEQDAAAKPDTPVAKPAVDAERQAAKADADGQKQAAEAKDDTQAEVPAANQEVKADTETSKQAADAKDDTQADADAAKPEAKPEVKQEEKGGESS